VDKQAVVSIVKVREGIRRAVREAVDLIGGMSSLVSNGDKVLIKPNFIREEPSFVGTTTNIEVVQAAVDLTKEAGAQAIVGEASGNQYDTEDIYRNLGLRESLNDVEVLDLDRDEIVDVRIKGARALKEVGVARTALEADFIVSVPVLKTHMTTQITLGMKNMMGVLPQREKWKMHISGLHQAIVDLNRLVKPGLVIIDGTVGMEGLGPTIGTPVRMDLIIAGTDVVAVEAVGAAVMGYSPPEVKHLMLAGQQGLGVNQIERIEIRGERIEDVARRFKRPCGSEIFLIWGAFQYRVGRFLLTHFGYDIRPFLKAFSDIYVTKPKLNRELCTRCGDCLQACQKGAIEMESYPKIDYGRCSKCLRCVQSCPAGALSVSRKPAWML